MKKKRRTKKEKLHLIFNEEERRDFLLGFQKRKQARKLKAKEEFEIALKEEKKKMKLEQRDALKNMLISQRGVPEIEHLLEPTVYDLPDHTVTISEVPTLDIHALTPMEPSASLENENTISETTENSTKNADILKAIKEQRLKALKQSSVFSVSKILQKKKDKKESKKKKQLLKQNLKRTKKNRRSKSKNKRK